MDSQFTSDVIEAVFEKLSNKVSDVIANQGLSDKSQQILAGAGVHPLQRGMTNNSINSSNMAAGVTLFPSTNGSISVGDRQRGVQKMQNLPLAKTQDMQNRRGTGTLQRTNTSSGTEAVKDYFDNAKSTNGHSTTAQRTDINAKGGGVYNVQQGDMLGSSTHQRYRAQTAQANRDLQSSLGKEVPMATFNAAKEKARNMGNTLSKFVNGNVSAV